MVAKTETGIGEGGLQRDVSRVSDRGFPRFPCPLLGLEWLRVVDLATRLTKESTKHAGDIATAEILENTAYIFLLLARKAKSERHILQ